MNAKHSQDFLDQREQTAQKGRKILLLIIAFNFVYLVFCSFLELNLSTIIYNVALNYWLYTGYKFARYLCAIGSGFASIIILLTLPNLPEVFGIVITGMYGFFCLALLVAAYILLNNEALITYLSKKRSK